MAQSLAQPGGNVTGLTVMEPELDGKRFETLKQAVPGLHKVGLMVSRVRGQTPGRTARALRRRVRRDGLHAPRCLNFARKEIADRAIGHKLPTIFALRENVEAGGFLSYAARLSDPSRRAAFFVDRILKGTKPADIPIEQPTTFELVINMKTAKALGLTVPDKLRALADEVIE